MALLFLMALACDESERPPPPPPPPPPSDAGPIDAARMDSGPRRDAGPTGVMIDGIVTDREWDDAVIATATVATDRPGSELSRLLVQIVDDTLYIAVEGSIADGDVLVVYVDHALGEPEGVDDLAALTDDDPALDDAISSPLMTPAAFAADVAWGTTAMSRTPVGLDQDTGWRTLAGDRAHMWLATEAAPSACSDAACEASIPLATLGGAAPRTIAIFARIVSGAGGWTNQTLPEDDPMAPGIVNALVTIDDGVVTMDGGITDAGIADAGFAGIRIDGRLDPGEWASAQLFTNVVTTIGAFVGNDVSALYVLRDATTLYVAIEGTVTGGNAIVLYVDHDEGGFDGIASPTPLADFVGALDTALSKSMVTPSELRLDMAWGTLDMNRDAVIGDDRMGWRNIGSNPLLFGNVPGMTSCGPNICETSIALSDLGVASGDNIGLYVRLVSATSAAFSNQTLPADDGFSPEIVSVYGVAPPP